MRVMLDVCVVVNKEEAKLDSKEERLSMVSKITEKAKEHTSILQQAAIQTGGIYQVCPRVSELTSCLLLNFLSDHASREQLKTPIHTSSNMRSVCVCHK